MVVYCCCTDLYSKISGYGGVLLLYRAVQYKLYSKVYPANKTMTQYCFNAGPALQRMSHH